MKWLQVVCRKFGHTWKSTGKNQRRCRICGKQQVYRMTWARGWTAWEDLNKWNAVNPATGIEER